MVGTPTGSAAVAGRRNCHRPRHQRAPSAEEVEHDPLEVVAEADDDEDSKSQ